MKYRKFFIVLILFSALIYNEYSYIRKSKFSIDANSAEFFKKLPGSFMLIVLDGGKSKKFSIENGTFQLKESVPFPPNYLEQRPYNYYFMKEEGLKGPNIEGYYYHGPYRINQDNSLAVFSLSSINHKDSSKNFILVDWNNKNIITKFNLSGSVVDIYWSPDSKMFSILERVNDGHRISILSAISSISGHPQSLYSYWISFYDDKGKVLNKSQIGNKSMVNGIQLIWK